MHTHTHTYKIGAGNMAQLVWCLPRTHEALGSQPINWNIVVHAYNSTLVRRVKRNQTFKVILDMTQ